MSEKDLIKNLNKSPPPKSVRTSESIAKSQKAAKDRVELKRLLREKGFLSVDEFLISLLKKNNG